MNIDKALHTFIDESKELLDQLETTLLRLEDDASDQEAINELFRAAHTVKGSAGMFGFEGVVSFTHVVESVLERLRDQELIADKVLISLLLQSVDHIGLLVDSSINETVIESAAVVVEKNLVDALQEYLGADDTPESTVADPSKLPEIMASAGVERDDNADIVDREYWHLSLRFHERVLQNGMDPASFIRYLHELGDIVKIITLSETMPNAQKMNPENCYLGFEITLKSDAGRQEIMDVFEFVEDDCEIHLLPPHCKVNDYIQLIEALPEDALRLGEILMAHEIITGSELKHILSLQEKTDDVSSQGQGSRHKPVGELLVENNVVSQPVVDAALQKQQQVAGKRDQSVKFVKVPADKLDELINLVGELVTASAGSHMLSQDSGQTHLIESTSTVSGLVEQIRDNSLQLRMVPIGETFDRFRRVVRDVSAELGKTINLSIHGADTELDKTVVDKVGDPLMHLVRNALDHGIETAEQRRQQGKPETGSLSLNAYHDSGSIVIEVSDDGGGLDADKILAKAYEKGLLTSEVDLNDQEIFNLIMEPGFSTADSVSNLSGRGVGMDVVKRSIEALRGTIELHSRKGEGTQVQMRLPLTLAIIDGFLVQAGHCTYVVPLDMIVECVEITAEESAVSREESYINLRGEVLPFLRLREVFDLDGTRSAHENIVVVQSAGVRAGFLVDELLGEFQTVIKPLGPLFGHLQGISGSSILGSGEVVMILDVHSLIQRTINRGQRSNLLGSHNHMPKQLDEISGKPAQN